MKKSFFKKKLMFSPNSDYKPNNEHISRNLSNFTTRDKNNLYYDFIDGSKLNGNKKPKF